MSRKISGLCALRGRMEVVMPDLTLISFVSFIDKWPRGTPVASQPVKSSALRSNSGEGMRVGIRFANHFGTAITVAICRKSKHDDQDDDMVVFQAWDPYGRADIY